MKKEINKIKRKIINDKKDLSRISTIFAYFRFALFIGIVLLSIDCFLNNSNVYFIGSLGFLVLVFIIVMFKHKEVDDNINKYDKYLELINEYDKRRKNDFNYFKDTGYELIKRNKELIKDLDLVGENSLFQLINISKSINGRRRLVDKLSLYNINKNDIKDNQDAIKEIKSNFMFLLELQEIESRIKDISDTDFDKYIDVLNKDKHISKGELLFGIICALITSFTFVLGIFNVIPILVFVLLMLVQLLISYLYLFKYSNEFENISLCSRNFSKLKELYSYIDNVSFDSKKLNLLKEDISNGLCVIDKLKRISNLDAYRFNFLTNVFLNAVYSLNIVVLYKYNSLVSEYDKVIVKSIRALEELESLCSLSTLCFIKDELCIPELLDEVRLDVKGIKHPLLNESKCVSNDFKSLDDINIITGSNMSGKTSFMQMLAINLVLMYNGAFVNALEFKAPFGKIFTSIRVEDDINNGISTFYGELLRIKSILDYSSKNEDEPIIVFIDEIFKGTNYNDRILGAKEIISKLIELNAIGVITTHDFELCEINNKKIYNYHFREKYEGDKIIFNYKINDGMCKTTNAKYLMGKIGIIEE